MEVMQDEFPTTPISKYLIKKRLAKIKNSFKKSNIHCNLGALCTNSDPYLAEVYGSFLKYNPNNIGNWSLEIPKYNTQQMEYEVIKKMIDLYKAKKEGLEGYVTSGGTEGNIYSLWLGKSHLLKFCKKKQIALLLTKLTHYSVKKAGNIADISCYYVSLNSTTWGMDSNGLQNLIKRLYRQGKKGFLIPLTIGYTLTGTHDNIREIIGLIEKIKKDFPDIHFYVWIDAALNGLIEPFLNLHFVPFYSRLIKTIVVDFHKFGMVPYSAGIVLYRRQLRRTIEKPIEYLGISDSTLLGSRSGSSVASIWTAIHMFGKNGYQKIVEQQMQNKQRFINSLRIRFSTAELINNDNSLSCAVIFHSLKNNRLPQVIENKYWLYPTLVELSFYPRKKRKYLIYKFFFLPHIKDRIIADFFSDCKNENIK